MNIKNYYWAGLLFFATTSCSKTEYLLDQHESVLIEINPSEETKPMTLTDYSVDSVCTLEFPKGIKLCDVSKIIVKNDRIYIMDSKCAHTIFVFAESGKYLFKLGERGRAKHEYTREPTDFFVDNMNNTHVFDREGQKVISFTKKGEVFRVVITGEHFPHSFGLTGNNKYAYCIADKSKEEEQIPALMFSNWNGEDKKNILPFTNNYYFHPSNRTFFSNDLRLSHIPILSDSVLVFNNDSLEKVVHFDFGGRFITNEMPEAVSNMDKISAITTYSGVLSLNEYQETNDLIYLEYIYNMKIMRWLHNKRTKKTINTKDLFEGTNPFTNYFLKNNQIIAFINQDLIDELKEISHKEDINNNLLKSAPQVRDLIEGKIKAPALFYITLK